VVSSAEIRWVQIEELLHGAIFEAFGKYFCPYQLISPHPAFYRILLGVGAPRHPEEPAKISDLLVDTIPTQGAINQALTSGSSSFTEGDVSKMFPQGLPGEGFPAEPVEMKATRPKLR
jgi:hypothetical protein